MIGVWSSVQRGVYDTYTLLGLVELRIEYEYHYCRANVHYIHMKYVLSLYLLSYKLTRELGSG